MIQPEQLVGEEWAEWYRMTPALRWLESEKLWATFLLLGGSLDPDPDTQSPFFDPKALCLRPDHGGQACVLYGAAEFSRDTDLVFLADVSNLPFLGRGDAVTCRLRAFPFGTISPTV